MSLAPERAIGAIQVYEAENHRRYSGEGRETKLYDLIADVLLFAKSEGLDVDEILTNAVNAYDQERDEVTSQ
ncbi:hypothetical protein AB0C87_24850 [Actinomadura sp. NPDC048021]|uniref:hypothetical protein n=1 Tax=Actinomadura sp. NPDC048021 TaxID=3155385 RepID=UPI0033D6728E